MLSKLVVAGDSCFRACRLGIAAVILVLPLASGCASPPGVQAPAASSPSSPSAPADATIMADGRLWARKFYERDTQALWNQFTPEMQAFMKSKKDLDEFRNEVEGQVGKESKVVEERVEHEGKGVTYVRSATFERSNMRFNLKIGFDASGKIDLFGMKAADQLKEAPSAYLQYTTRTPLRLPFDGAWTVVWGGRTIRQNRHAAVRDQRFAYDFLIAKDNKSYRTTGKENADYLAFGQPVLAPAAGKVVAVVEGIEDNVPGQMNREQPLGNHVVIDHGQGEFSFLVHLKKGSARVKVDERVEAGAPIGSCGNSGNSSEPHLHYHLQNTAVFAQGDGLPAQFRNYTSSGRFVDSGEPGREERVVNGRE